MRIQVNGVIASDEDAPIYRKYNYAAFAPQDARQALRQLRDGEPLELEINSPGGNVFAGYEIYSLLLEAACPTVAIVQSMAASAASTIASACKDVRISPVAQLMIHLPTSGSWGNRNAHLSTIQTLDSITEGIINGYVRKCGGKCSRETLQQLIEQETWISAARAVELGLADSILGGPLVSNALDLPDLEELRARYAAENSWQDRAAEEITEIANYLKGLKRYA